MNEKCDLAYFSNVTLSNSFGINEVEMMTSNHCVTSSVEDGWSSGEVHENDTTMPGALTYGKSQFNGLAGAAVQSVTHSLIPRLATRDLRPQTTLKC